MEVSIKTATPEDWKLIQQLNYQVFESDSANDDDLDLEYPFSDKGQQYYKNLAGGEYGKCFIAYINEAPVGYAAIAVKDFGYRKSKYVEVENMGVDPKYRSQGIGKLLMEAAEKWAKEQGATKLYVSAYWGNKRAVDFYKRNGFYEIGLELDKKI